MRLSGWGLAAALALVVLSGCAGPSSEAGPSSFTSPFAVSSTSPSSAGPPTAVTEPAPVQVPEEGATLVMAVPWNQGTWAGRFVLPNATDLSLFFSPYQPTQNDSADRIGYGFMVLGAEAGDCEPRTAWVYAVDVDLEGGNRNYLSSPGGITLPPGNYSVVVWRHASLEGKPTSVSGPMTLRMGGEDNLTVPVGPGPYQLPRFLVEEGAISARFGPAELAFLTPEANLPFPFVGDWTLTAGYTRGPLACPVDDQSGTVTLTGPGPEPTPLFGLTGVTEYALDLTATSMVPGLPEITPASIGWTGLAFETA